jgi:tRNA(adenine34) deaminase
VDDDRALMALALREARRAVARGEVPVGAVVVRDGRVLARAGNASVGPSDPCGHAEVRALRAAARRVGNYRLPGARLYATLEPCVMCMGAMIHARIDELVYGAADPKTGAAASRYEIGRDRRLNHTVRIRGGVGAEESAELLRAFFAERRRRRSPER